MVRKFLGNGGARWKRECNKPKTSTVEVLVSLFDKSRHNQIEIQDG